MQRKKIFLILQSCSCFASRRRQTDRPSFFAKVTSKTSTRRVVIPNPLIIYVPNHDGTVSAAKRRPFSHPLASGRPLKCYEEESDAVYGRRHISNEECIRNARTKNNVSPPANSRSDYWPTVAEAEERCNRYWNFCRDPSCLLRGKCDRWSEPRAVCSDLAVETMAATQVSQITTSVAYRYYTYK